MPVDASALRLRTYPDPVLRRKALQVPAVDDEVRSVARRMIEMMREHEGIGLAAPQAGIPWRIFVANVPERDDLEGPEGVSISTEGTVVYVNPVLSKPSGPVEPFEEGCLSLPDIRGDVLRPPVVTMTALDLEGRTFTKIGAGLLARCWQHEVDHLDGVLIIDKMTQVYRMKNRLAIRDLERDADA